MLMHLWWDETAQGFCSVWRAGFVGGMVAFCAVSSAVEQCETSETSSDKKLHIEFKIQSNKNSKFKILPEVFTTQDQRLHL